MKNQKTDLAPNKISLIKRTINKVKNAWRAYSKAVDMAYSRHLTYDHAAEAELCSNTSREANIRPGKGTTFNDYSSGW